MKTCAKCRAEKPLDYFTKRAVSPDGLHTRCKACANEQGRAYRHANRERINAQEKVRDDKKRETIKARQREYRQANREALLERKREYRKNNPEMIRGYYLKHRDRYKAHAKAYYERTRERARARERKNLYDLTPAQYCAMVSAADGKCEICRREPGKRPLVVDHCHDTSVVRGVLCGKCNSALGMFHNSPETLLRAVEYLKTRAGGHPVAHLMAGAA